VLIRYQFVKGRYIQTLQRSLCTKGMATKIRNIPSFHQLDTVSALDYYFLASRYSKQV